MEYTGKLQWIKVALCTYIPSAGHSCRQGFQNKQAMSSHRSSAHNAGLVLKLTIQASLTMTSHNCTMVYNCVVGWSTLIVQLGHGWSIILSTVQYVQHELEIHNTLPHFESLLFRGSFSHLCEGKGTQGSLLWTCAVLVWLPSTAEIGHPSCGLGYQLYLRGIWSCGYPYQQF